MHVRTSWPDCIKSIVRCVAESAPTSTMSSSLVQWAAELWDFEKCVAYLKAEQDAEHEEMKNSAQYKRYKRWQKKEGKGKK